MYESEWVNGRVSASAKKMYAFFGVVDGLSRIPALTNYLVALPDGHFCIKELASSFLLSILYI